MTLTASGGDISLPDTLHLDRSLVSGIGWTVVLRMASRAFGWVYVVRILTPADFGLMAMASMRRDRRVNAARTPRVPRSL